MNILRNFGSGTEIQLGMRFGSESRWMSTKSSIDYLKQHIIQNRKKITINNVLLFKIWNKCVFYKHDWIESIRLL